MDDNIEYTGRIWELPDFDINIVMSDVLTLGVIIL
jgi:hypothetical protein